MGELDEEGVDVKEQKLGRAKFPIAGWRPTWARSDSIGALAGALAKAQPNFGGAAKDKLAKIEGRGGNYSYKYADLASIREACVSALGAQGLTVLQPVVTEESGEAVLVTVATLLAHASGEWVSAEQRVEVPPRTYTDRNGEVKTERPDARTLGSWETYLKKYGLASMVGVATEDDDGEAAQTKHGNGHDSPPASPAPVPKAAEDILLRLELVKGIEVAERPSALAVILKEIQSAPKSIKEAVREKFAEVKAVVESGKAAH